MTPPFSSCVVGISVARFVAESYVTVAGTGVDVPAFTIVELEDVIVAGFIARENVTVGWMSGVMPASPSFGEVAVTVGAAPTVVNCHVNGAESGVPSLARMPVVTVAV